MSEQPTPAQAPAPQSEQQLIEEGKIFALLAYLGILCLVPLLAKKDNKFAYFHAKQGLVLFIVEVVLFIVIAIVSVVIGIIGGIIGHGLGFITGILSLLLWLLWLLCVVGFLALSIMGIVNSLNGKYWEMPVLGKYAQKFKF
jgi:uncharacterized membrane protein